jgi:hypothetical protein
MEVNTDWKTTAVSDDSISTMQQNRLVRSIFAGNDPFLAFNNTAFAVELGLLEVVKFLIEDKGVDPNEYGWTLVGIHRVHLVSVAMTSGQKDIFQYLLSLPSTNLYSEIDKNDARKHGLFEQALDKYVGYKKEKAYLTSLVNHNRFDVNRACHRCNMFTESNFPCLFIALVGLKGCLNGFEGNYPDSRYGPLGNEDLDLAECDSERLGRHIDGIKLLLEAGANPNQNLMENVGGSIDLVVMWLRNVHPNVGYYSFRLLSERVYRQLLAMMRQVQAPQG